MTSWLLFIEKSSYVLYMIIPIDCNTNFPRNSPSFHNGSQHDKIWNIPI